MGQEFVPEAVAVRHEQRITVIEAIRDGDPLPYGRRGGGRQWVPERMRVTVERSRIGDAPWGPWVALACVVTGHSRKVDGSAGAERSVRLYGHGLDDPEAGRLVQRLAEIEAEIGRDGERVRHPEACAPSVPRSPDLVDWVSAPPPE